MMRPRPCRTTARSGGPLASLVSMICLLLYAAVAGAQTPERARDFEPLTPPTPPSFGAYGGLGLSNVRSSFAVDSSGFIPRGECGLFEEGTATSTIVGGIFSFTPIRGYRIALAPELRFSSASLSYPCVDPAHTRLPDGSVVAAVTNFKADVATTAASLRMLLVSTPFSLPLDFSVGPVISLSLGGSYEAWEEIGTPREAEFVSGGQTRAISRGDLPSSPGPSLAIGGGVSYRARIGRSLELVPEIGYMIDLGTHDQPLALSERALRLTLGVLYTPEPSSPPSPVLPPVIPPVIPPLALRASLQLDAIEPSGQIGDTLEYSLRRTVTTRLHPLLSYIFFDTGSDTIDRRYHQRRADEAAGFIEEKIETASVLETYHNVLDIIGSRLRRRPDATITVTGTQPDLNDPELKLARRRAERVAGYLRSTWSIDPGRIRIATRARPLTASNEETEDGRQENRRVEIASDLYEIVAPVLLADTAITSEVSGIRAGMSTPDSARVARWALVLRRDTAIALKQEGTGAPPPEIRRPELILEGGSGELLEYLDGSLHVRDAEGRETIANDRIAVRHSDESDIVDYGAGQYSLILFDFGRADLRAEHQRIIDLINSRTPPGSRSTVAGFTDRLGEAALNLDLSRQRAATVARTLEGTIEKVVGEGEERLLYDNALPEGRFYSRCVTVEVRTGQ